MVVSKNQNDRKEAKGSPEMSTNIISVQELKLSPTAVKKNKQIALWSR